MKTKEISDLFGARYFPKGLVKRAVAQETDLYYYECFIGPHSINVDRGDCVYWIDVRKSTAYLSRGPTRIDSPIFATLIRGYAPENKTSEFHLAATLPYVNGCSTKQIFPPERPGDPSLQFLHMPPFSSEQAHHIHSTVRCVYVLAGTGTSVVGMNKKTASTKLRAGMVCILNRMCPHHFETKDSSLIVLPVHVWSTTPNVENIHPMFNGTFAV